MSLPAAKTLKVFTRDNFACQFCGAAGVALECDHVTPKSWGGSDDYTNLVTACGACNREKTAMNLPTYMVYLRERHGMTAKQTAAIARRVRAALARAIP